MNPASKELYDRLRQGLIDPVEGARHLAALRQGGNGHRAAPQLPGRLIFRHDEPLLRDHRVGGKQVLIGVLHASLAIDAHLARFPEVRAVQLRQLTLLKPIELQPGEQAEVEVVEDTAASPGAFKVRFRLAPDSPWQETASGIVARTNSTFDRRDLKTLQAEASVVLDPRDVYALGEPQFQVGPSFRAIRQLFRGVAGTLAEVDLSEAIPGEVGACALHPVLTYSVFTALVPLLGEAGFSHAFLPFGIKSLELRADPKPTSAWIVARVVKATDEMVLFDAEALSADGEEVARFRGCSVKRLRLGPVEAPARPPGLRPAPGAVVDQSGADFIRDYLLRELRLPANDAPLDTNLMELGMASAQLVELAAKISSETGLSLDPTLFFEFPTLRELTRYFAEHHRGRFAELAPPSPRDIAGSEPPAAVLPQLTPTAPVAESESRTRTTDGPEVTAATSAPTRDARPVHPPPLIRSRDIAVIGMDGRFPGADNLAQFWDCLWQGADPISEVPLDHWDYRPWFDAHPGTPDKTYCKWGGFIAGVDGFDASFFDIPAEQAGWLDPQVRLLLQSVYAAAEDAGMVTRLRGTPTGVFVGLCSTDHQDRIAALRLPVDPRRTGVSGSESAANRVSYWFDLQGPSLVFNTACSSSLVALHSACQALRNRECELAFVAGTNLLLDSRHYRHFSAIGALSPTGRCRPFDAQADGYVPGECVGTVLLKPLERALRDGDHVHAVLKGSAALHAGHAPALTAPSVVGQENVLLKAWADAGIDPRTLSYLECHGTGTPLGDSIELAALKKAFARFGAPPGSCAIGSVKAHLGHTEGAAGIASLLKVILQLRHRQIPGLLHFQRPHEYLRLDGSPLHIRAEGGAWEQTEGPRRAGISAFGFSGSYAHVVVEEAPPARRMASTIAPPASPVPVVLSAKDEARLRQAVRNLAQFLEHTPAVDLAELGYTLQVGRQPMEERVAFIAASTAGLQQTLHAWLGSPEPGPNPFRGRATAASRALNDLTLDEDMAPTLRTWFEKGKHARLLSLWVQGGSIDWHRLHGENHPNLISIPTYPFAPHRYGLPETETEYVPSPSVSEGSTIEKQTAGELWQFLPPGEGSASAGQPIELTPEAKAERFVLEAVAGLLRCPAESIDVHRTFLELGLGSMGLVELAHTLGCLLGVELAPTLLFEHASVPLFAAHLAASQRSPLDRLRVVRQRTPMPPPPDPSGPESACPLSEGQLGLWALQQTSPAMAAYNCPLCFRAHEAIDVDRFRDACRILLREHPLLSARVEQREGLPVLVPQPAQAFELQRVEARAWSEEELLGRLERTAKLPFDLAKGPLLRASLFTRSERETVVLFTVHHLVFDGSSFPLLLRGLLEAYRRLREGRPPETAGSAAPYREYVLAERARTTGPEGVSRLAFWRERLTSPPPPLEFPWDFPKSTARTFAGKTVSLRAPAEWVRRLEAFGRQHTLFASSVFLAAFSELLHLHSRQGDITVGMPVNERSDPRFAGTIGYFVNVIPVRNRDVGRLGFLDFAQNVQREVLAGLAHRLPFPALVRELRLSGQGEHPLFQAAFEYQNFIRPSDVETVRQAVANAFPLTTVEGLHQEGEYELALEVLEQTDGFQLQLKFNPTLLREATANRLLTQLFRLIESALEHPQRPPAADLFLSDSERHTLLREWNSTARDYPREACIHEFFEHQARRNPRAVAVVCGERTLTYRELNEQSTRWALALQERGVEPDTLVGLYFERSVEMVVGLLAVLKAGGAYLPLDPDYPRDRLAFMAEDSRIRWLLTQSRLASDASKWVREGTEVLVLDGSPGKGGSPTRRRRSLQRRVRGENLACVLYTSGSTGTPKGVLSEHRALCNRILWMQQTYPLDAQDRVLQKTPYSFDVSGWEFHWPLLAGARIVLAAPGKHKDPEYLCALIQSQGITVLHFVPAMLQAFLALDRVGDCRSLRHVFCSGEELIPAQAERFFERFDRTQLHNLYGPTEAAIDVSAKQCQPGARVITIGKPIANVQLHVLDTQLRLLPIGFVGELCIAGDALARGYLNRAELTAERFVPHPLEPSGRVYRTGDLARWTPDGEIEFLGRMDQQVKIRGCRVELGEIEAALVRLPSVREAAVIAQGDGQEKRLIAYYSATVPDPDPRALRRQLRERLPEHMVPSVLVALASLPVTSSGKLDRRSLAQRPIGSAAGDGDGDGQPRTPTELRLAALWREALSRKDVGIHDSFFDLGGHSLSALTLMAKINAAFGVALPMATLFEARSIADLASRLDTPSAPAVATAPLPLQAQGGRPPLFLVPGIGSTGLSFVPLSRALGPDQPSFLLRLPGMQGEEELPETIPDLAAYCVGRLPALAPGSSGYRLGGWSLGGVVAFEMACQLRHRGLPVAGLVLIDSYLPTHFVRFGLRIDPAAADEPRAGAEQSDAGLAPQLARVSAAQARALACYRPTESFAGPVLYLWASEHPGRAPTRKASSRPAADRPAEGEVLRIVQELWQPHLPRLEEHCVSIAGTHDSILREPRVQPLAEALRAFLEKLT